MHQSILSHSSYRYLWISTILLVASIAAYAIHNPPVTPNGGTWLGYTLGSIGAAIILWLMWFGVRKRRYSSSVGTLTGWLSAHVYLGTSLLLIATLHTGFQFGWNIHTVAYVLMVVVIISGFFGVFAYLRYPTMMTRNRGGLSRQSMIEEIKELDEECLSMADKLGPKVHGMVLKSIENTRLGGGVWAQLTAHDASESALDKARELLEGMQMGREPVNPSTREMPTMFAMVDFLAGSSGGEDAEKMRRLMDMLARKKALATQVAKDVQFQALMEIWLYFHVPVSFGLLASLTAHIVSVFFYW